ncbi:MAG: hypothetical protein H0A75_03760 [Candidatus Methanofishera endochildressiae]|uniref:Uncharacterized protein n=1 Tax=Candidatus Methanofishera endochildressiae TaxID=2738884 RepID=A0A7Z0MNB6_9GAMM|nr:hypothetical protein [Candidatus Methanofishera endochildressiae]
MITDSAYLSFHIIQIFLYIQANIQPASAEVTACFYTEPITSPAAKNAGYAGSCGITCHTDIDADIPMVSLSNLPLKTWA